MRQVCRRTVRSFAGEERECERFEAHLDATLGVMRQKCVAEIGFSWRVCLRPVAKDDVE